MAYDNDDRCQQRPACKQMLGHAIIAGQGHHHHHYVDKKLDLPFRCAVKCQPAIQLRSQLCKNKYTGRRCGNIFFTYVVEYHTITRTEYARIFYYHDFWCTLSFRPNTATLHLMISCKGELRNGTKYTELAYLLPISGNSGVLKRTMASD
jgi:hypothetical protein